MNLTIKAILLTFFFICGAYSVNAQMYLTYGHPYLVKHNQDGSVDVVEYAQGSCKKYWYTLEEALAKICSSPKGCDVITNESQRPDNYEETLILRATLYSYVKELGYKLGSNQMKIMKCGGIQSKEAFHCYFGHHPASSVRWEQMEELWQRDGEICYKETDKAEQYLLDFFEDSEGVGFKKIAIGYDYFLALRNDGVFRLKPGFKSGELGPLYTDALNTINKPIADFVLPKQHAMNPIFIMLIAEDGEQIPVYLRDPNLWYHIYNKDEVEAITKFGKPLMSKEWQQVAEVKSNEFKVRFGALGSVIVSRGTDTLGWFIPFKNSPGIIYFPKDLYVKDDSIFVSALRKNLTTDKDLKLVCGEWGKEPPFRKIPGSNATCE